MAGTRVGRPRPYGDSSSEFRWREKDDLLHSVPGVEERVALSLLAHLPEPDTLDRRQIAALVGEAHVNRHSGALRSECTVRDGRAWLRAALYMGAPVAIWHNLVCHP